MKIKVWLSNTKKWVVKMVLAIFTDESTKNDDWWRWISSFPGDY